MNPSAPFWPTWVGLTLSALALGYSLMAWLSVQLWRRTVQPAQPLPAARPPVTVLKPLCGAEEDLRECLRSFCEQDYPEFQIVFGVRDGNDPAVAVVRELQREYPQLEMHIATDPRQRGASRKVSNLINMMPHVRHDYLVIADSDVRVAPDYLKRVTAPLLDPRVGIVTCSYFGRPGPGFWSLLGSLFVNDWFMPSASIAALFGSRSFAFGATIAIRREVLAAIGGFAVLANQLADDYRLGERTRRMGLSTVLSDVVVETCVTERSFSELVKHELRWLRTIRTVRPVGYAMAFVSFGVPIGVIGNLLAAGSSAALLMLAITLLARLMLHSLTCRRTLPPWQLWMLPLNDFLGFALWCWGFVARQVQWRDIRYRVARDGSVHPIV